MSLNKEILKGSVWSVVGQFVYLLISLLVNIILARKLTPTEFGQMGIIMFFISVSNVFVESGFGGALIRQKKATKEDFSTVFVFNLIVSCLLFILLFIFSDLIVGFYADNSLKRPLITAGLVLIINAFTIIPNVKLMIDMKYKERYFYLIIASLISATVSIFLAYSRFGIWALVSLNLLTPLMFAIFLYIKVNISISLRFFSKESFVKLFGFGFYTTMTSVITQAFNNVYQLILGKYFSMNQVGYYYQANKIQEIPGGILRMLSNSVIYSGLSKIQNDEKLLYTTYSKIIAIFLSLLGLFTICICLYSEIIIKLILGSQWVDATIYLQLLSFASYFYIQESFNRILFKIYNRTDRLLYIEVFKKLIQVISIVIGVLLESIYILLLGYIVVSCLGYIFNYILSRRLIKSKLIINNKELIFTFKVLLIIVLLLFLAQLSTSYINYSCLSSLWMLVLYVPLYLGCIHFMKIVNCTNLFRQLINYKNKLWKKKY